MDNFKQIIHRGEKTNYYLSKENNVHRMLKNGEIKEKPLEIKMNKGKGRYVGIMHDG